MIDPVTKDEKHWWHAGYREAVHNFGTVFLKGYLAGALSALIATARWWT
jgi:hypothetical protein